MNKIIISAVVFGVGAMSPASARDAEIEYPDGALGYNAIISADYSTAERQLKSYAAHKNDPARLINYGTVLAKTGRTGEAAKQFKRAMEADEIELILADGRTITSREAAVRALRALEDSAPDQR